MRTLKFKGQVYFGFAISIVIIVVTAIFFYRNLNHANEDTRNWMQITVNANTAVDSIEQRKNRIDFEIIAFVSNGNPTHLRNIQSEQFTISMDLDILAENTRKIGIGALMIDHLRILLNKRDEANIISMAQRRQSTVRKLEEVKFESQRISRQLILLKQAIRSKRKIELENRQNKITETKYIALSGLALTVSLLLALIGYIFQTFNVQKKSERLIRKANIDLNKLSKEREAENWILKGLAVLDDKTRGGLGENEIAAKAIQSVCQHLNAKIGLIYLESSSNEEVFIHAGSYAASKKNIQPKIMKSQGLIGECVASKSRMVLSDVPENYLTVLSSLGNANLKNIVIQPLVYENEVLGVMEIGFFRKIDNAILQFLDRAGIMLAVATKVARTHATLTGLFEETQQQAEELEAQQEELRTTNDELMHKTHLLEASEEELRVQQEELKHANLELEEKARLLEEHNFSIEQARQSIAMKASELEQSGRYKSEFLANMSHELRTPLNSILILAKLLEDNKSRNLLPDQVKYAAVIHNAGTDLLNLINNILDLAKIESGNVELVEEDIAPATLAEDMRELFNSVTESKAIDFEISINKDLPDSLHTDEQRLKQILKNLLSNAFKFTKENGQVKLRFSRATRAREWKEGMLGGINPNDAIAIAVTDTGIGISEDKQQLIFEAFKQADGSTSRKFGGTGLGLSICRELATVLGGEIHVASQLGKGSTFTLFLPFHRILGTNEQPTKKMQTLQDISPNEEKSSSKPILSQKQKTSTSKRLLIIEDDQNFAEILEQYAREQGFDTFVAHQGDTGLQMAMDYLPDAIILDIMLPVMDGWSVLKKLKSTPDTKDIPVHLISAASPGNHNIKKEDAVGFLQKPIDKKSLEDVFGHLHKIVSSPLKKVLVVEDHKIQSDSLRSNLVENGVEVKQAFTGTEAIDALKSGEHFDCIILDINLPDKSGMDLLDDIKNINQHENTPVIINTAMELNAEMTNRILQYTKTMVIKSDKSNNRILDEVNLFINKVKNNKGSNLLYAFNHFESKELQLDNVLEGKHILLADDDMRNIFALSTVFESYNIKVEIANNGLEALEVLQKKQKIDLVLMDIMMPEMDGYEAITKIRSIKKFAKLPVIAITAKAMQGDRQLVLDAGANDYIAKPVDIDKLLSLMRVWLS
ncbi:response regulator [Parapedobacter tibetensis]|uniref:response regulator n=1 Tax=Parapedobacter tibetensis TaxID=2972951 RepID=UPI00214D9BC0|nr:response regulator [Parapedobacter tibetensis]